MSDICRKPTEKERNSFALRLTVDQLTMWGGPEWQRREASRKRTPPSEEEWAAYLVAEAHLEAARQYEGFDEGCSCDHASVREPTDHVEVEYAETVEEWGERVFALADEQGGWPTIDDYYARAYASAPVRTAVGVESVIAMQDRINQQSLVMSLGEELPEGSVFRFKEEE